MLINGREYASRPPAGDVHRRGSRRGDTLAAPPDRLPAPSLDRARTPQRYERAESSSFTTSADADAIILRISGNPDSIMLSAQAFGAIFTLTDFLGRNITELHVAAGDSQESYLRAARVSVRNAVAGSAALVMAVAKWALPYEAT